MGKRQDNPKITYEVDPYNRLIINSFGKNDQLSRFRQVLDTMGGIIFLRI